MLPDSRQQKYYHITAKDRSNLAEKGDQWLEFLAAMNLIIRPVSA